MKPTKERVEELKERVDRGRLRDIDVRDLTIILYDYAEQDALKAKVERLTELAATLEIDLFTSRQRQEKAEADYNGAMKEWREDILRANKAETKASGLRALLDAAETLLILQQADLERSRLLRKAIAIWSSEDSVVRAAFAFRQAKASTEPSQKDIEARMRETGESFFNSRERLREDAYGGKPPSGFSCCRCEKERL